MHGITGADQGAQLGLDAPAAVTAATAAAAAALRATNLAAAATGVECKRCELFDRRSRVGAGDDGGINAVLADLAMQVCRAKVEFERHIEGLTNATAKAQAEFATHSREEAQAAAAAAAAAATQAAREAQQTARKAADAEIAAERASHSQTKARVAELERELAGLRGCKADADQGHAAELDRLTSQLAEAESRAEAAAAEASRVAAATATAKERARDRVRAATDEHCQTVAALSELQAEHACVSQKLAKVVESRRKATAAAAEQARRFEELQSTNAELRANLDKARVQTTKQAALLEAEQKRCAALGARKAAGAELGLLEAELDAAAVELQRARSATRRQTKAAQAAETELVSLRAKVTKLEGDIAKLTTKLKRALTEANRTEKAERAKTAARAARR